MKHLIKKFSVSNSEMIGRINFGNKSLAFIAKNNIVRGIFDGYEIYNFNLNEKSANKSFSVVAALINEIGKKQDSKITIYKDLWKNDKYSFIDSILPQLDQDAFTIRVKPKINLEENVIMAPHFNIDNAININYLCTNLSVFKSKINGVGITIKDALDLIMSMTHITLIKTMWGSKEVQNIINDIRDNFSNMDFSNNLETCLEMINKSIDRIIHKFKSDFFKACAEEKKMVASVLIPTILKNYEILKEMLIKLLSFLSPLVNINKVFEDNTKCPASWFMSDIDMKNVKDTFKELASFMIQIPAIESKVIDPIDFYRLQLLEGIKD